MNVKHTEACLRCKSTHLIRLNPPSFASYAFIAFIKSSLLPSSSSSKLSPSDCRRFLICSSVSNSVLGCSKPLADREIGGRTASSFNPVRVCPVCSSGSRVSISYPSSSPLRLFPNRKKYGMTLRESLRRMAEGDLGGRGIISNRSILARLEPRNRA